jgi:hypothetical protein
MSEIAVIEKPIATLKSNPKFREGVVKFEAELRARGGIIGDSPEYLKICPLKHTFVDGAYVRELFMPKGLLFVTKIHKITHPYFLMKGDCSILTEEGVKRIKGPFSGVTLAGTKRVIYTHEDTIWITVHVTKERDLEKIEEQVIAKTYDEVPNLVIDIEAEEVKILEFIDSIKKEITDEAVGKT